MRGFRGKACLLLGLSLGMTTGCVNLPIVGEHAISRKPVSETPTQAELPARETAKASLLVAESLEKNGHEADAIPQYEKARAADPSLAPRVTHRLAILYDRKGDHIRAHNEFQYMLKLRPKDPDLLNDVGYSHYNRGQWDEAEKYLRQATTLDPKHARAWTNLGLTLGQQGRYDESVNAFRQVVGPAEAECNLAFILATQGKRSQATDAYRRALSIEPGMPLALAALAKLEASENPVPPLVKSDKNERTTPVQPTKLIPPVSPAPVPLPTPLLPAPIASEEPAPLKQP